MKNKSEIWDIKHNFTATYTYTMALIKFYVNVIKKCASLE